MKKEYLIIIILLFSISLKAQETFELGASDIYTVPENDSFGTALITQNFEINNLINKHIDYNRAIVTENEIAGWRVQIWFGSGESAKNTANSVKKTFKRKYPDTEAYITYKAPYFKVKVGNFRTRVEAMGMKKKLSLKYSSCWIIEDKIALPPID